VPRLIRALALTVLVLVPCAARAEVRVAPACRMKNRPPGRCGWCAVETLARHHGIRCLYGLVEDHARMASPDDLTLLLDGHRIGYRLQPRGYRDTAILRTACRDGLGAVIGFRPLYPGGSGHIVTLVDFGDEQVRVIDSNDQDGRVRTMTRERFLHWWDGFALVLQVSPEVVSAPASDR
jgi:hypothetical protein